MNKFLAVFISFVFAVSSYSDNAKNISSIMLIGNSFALVIYGLFMGQFIVDNLSFLFLPSMNELTVLLLQTIISTLLILIAAEFIPKVLFQIYSNLYMKIFSIPAFIFYIILYPLTSLVTIISNFILKTFLVDIVKVGSFSSFSKYFLQKWTL